MTVLAIVVGVMLVVTVGADLVHTLVTTSTSNGRWWLTRVLYQVSWSLISRCGKRRRTFDAQLEFLIDRFDAPRGFWGHKIGHRLEIPGAVPVDSTDSFFDV